MILNQKMGSFSTSLTMSENGYLSLSKKGYSGPMKRDDVFYQAMLARDARFDGKFFVGVKTTGIYCRPICPAKPKRENVEFFPNHHAAEKAGYRPCLRCRPESAPLSPAWVGKSALVRRAIRMIDRQESIDFDEDRFAGLFGVSARHLRRLFIEEIGKTPKQLSFENRLNLARKLITETALPMTEIAFASGFGSIRRFNAAFKERFKKSPSEVRRHRIPLESVIRLSLSYRPPYDFQGLLHFYRAHQMGDLESITEDSYSRVLFFNGKVGTVTVKNQAQDSCLIAEIDFPDTTMIHAIVARVRSMFDLDSDPVLVANALESVPALRKILKKHPGIRLPSGWDPFEVAVSAILGQLVSVERGRGLVKDLIEMIGERVSSEFNGRQIRLFPSPEKVWQADLSSLKTTQRRKETLKSFARALHEGTLSLNPAQDMDQFYQTVLAIPGVGPWTAQYMALKALKHTDAFPETDLVIARALEIVGPGKTDIISPWRGYLAALLWREYTGKLTKRSKK